jgi:hypothetical protein
MMQTVRCTVRLLSALVLVLVSFVPTVAAEPLNLGSELVLNFQNLQPTPESEATCSEALLSVCLGFNIVSGTGTIAFDLFDYDFGFPDDSDPAPITPRLTLSPIQVDPTIHAVQAANFGAITDGIGGTEVNAFLRIVTTGDLVFDYLSAFLVVTTHNPLPPGEIPTPDNWHTRRITLGAPPASDPRPVPEVSTFALLLLGLASTRLLGGRRVH